MSLSAKRESLARIHGCDQRAGRPHKTLRRRGLSVALWSLRSPRFRQERPHPYPVAPPGLPRAAGKIVFTVQTLDIGLWT